jgi:phosphotransferase system HPr (HPr) family protein
MSVGQYLAPSPCDQPGDSQAPPAPGRDGAVASVLVVDDDRDNVETMARLLELFGHDVHVARDGHQAIEMARRRRPGCMLLDVALPGLDGYEVASRLRRELGGSIVLIALTGYGRDEDRRAARAAGFDHHFLKPLDHDGMNALLAVLGAGNRSGSPAPVAEPAPAVRERDGRPIGGVFPIPGLMACEPIGREEAPMPLGSRQVEITNTLGLHLRAADKFVRLAQQFQAGVKVTCDGRKINGRSILDLATLAAVCGSRLELETDGLDAAAALDALTDLVKRGFDEDQAVPASIVTRGTAVPPIGRDIGPMLDS